MLVTPKLSARCGGAPADQCGVERARKVQMPWPYPLGPEPGQDLDQSLLLDLRLRALVSLQPRTSS